VVKRAGAYVQDFEVRFSNVVTEEHYLQESTESAGTPRRGSMIAALPQPIVQRRALLSDFLLVKISGTDGWVPFRDVFEVDTKRIRDRESRLAKLFLYPTGSTLEQAGKIMEESARYNIGSIQRTINVPVFALMVLRAADQRRFRFTKGKLDSSMGSNVYIIEYRERVPPALIQGPKGRDMFCHGRFWIEGSTGRVMKSELVVDDPVIRAAVTTTYQIDAAEGLAVPVEMKEDYRLPNGARVTGQATYGNFRRFDVEVTGETVVSPVP
jgi:hypothetical protein